MASLDFDDVPAAGKSTGGLSFDDVPVAPARRELPVQELSIGEKLVSMLPKGAQEWLSDPSIAGVGIGKGSSMHGAAMGAADPVVGAAQLLTGGQSSTINQVIDAKNAEYESARKGQGRDGFDVARLAGAMASPANIAAGAAVPIKSAAMIGRAAQGAAGGAVGASLAPVQNADESFVPEKLLQAGAGAVGGAVLAPAIGKAGDVVKRFLPKNPQQVANETDRIMREGINRLRAEGVEITQDNIHQLRHQVVSALNNGVEVDPVALMRKADFEALGMSPTLGQINRDPLQFAREKNLRGVSGVGEPLSVRFDDQAKRLQELITGQSAGAMDDSTAGAALIQSLRGVDDGMSDEINTAYSAARDHLGRAAPMDSAGFSTAANLAIDTEMLNGALPPQARDILNKVTTGEIPFTVNSAVMIDKRLSGMQRDLRAAGNKESALAVSKVRDALNAAGIADNVGEDAKKAFDAARGMAGKRFKLHELVPALKAAAEGDTSADDFVRRFLINGKSEDVAQLARVMPPEAKQEARRQFGAALERAAFGQNMTGDKAFAQESFAKLLNQSGMRQKLAAFFSPAEIEQINRVARVGSYITSAPSGSPVNNSNTAAAVMNLLSRIPGVPAGVGLLTSARNAAENQSVVNAALRAQPRTSATTGQMTPKQLEIIARTLGGAVTGTAGFTGTGVGN